MYKTSTWINKYSKFLVFPCNADSLSFFLRKSPEQHPIGILDFNGKQNTISVKSIIPTPRIFNAYDDVEREEYQSVVITETDANIDLSDIVEYFIAHNKSILFLNQKVGERYLDILCNSKIEYIFPFMEFDFEEFYRPYYSSFSRVNSKILNIYPVESFVSENFTISRIQQECGDRYASITGSVISCFYSERYYTKDIDLRKFLFFIKAYLSDYNKLNRKNVLIAGSGDFLDIKNISLQACTQPNAYILISDCDTNSEKIINVCAKCRLLHKKKEKPIAIIINVIDPITLEFSEVNKKKYKEMSEQLNTLNIPIRHTFDLSDLRGLLDTVNWDANKIG